MCPGVASVLRDRWCDAWCDVGALVMSWVLVSKQLHCMEYCICSHVLYCIQYCMSNIAYSIACVILHCSIACIVLHVVLIVVLHTLWYGILSCFGDVYVSLVTYCAEWWERCCILCRVV
jgi:hypothetical protein